MLTRITPTPSGYLHLGNAFSFLLTERVARIFDGKILLRIDDMDAERKRPEYVQDIFDSLNWLGIEWQLGPRDAEDFEARWSQRYRMPLYEKAIARLVSENKVFACSCSRKQLQEKGRCDCRNKNIPVNTPDTALRLKVPEETIVRFTDGILHEIDLSREMGPFVIRRRDGIPAYHLVSVVDDLHFGVTHAERGQDLFLSTAAQYFLAEQLGEPAFAHIRFHHHPLITDEEGRKLSKSEGALSLKAQREKGVTAETIRAHFEQWCAGNAFPLHS